MGKKLIVAGGMAAVIAGVLLVNCRTARPPASPAGTSAPVTTAPSAVNPLPPTPQSTVDRASAVPAQPSPAAKVEASVASPGSAADRFSERRNLSKPETTPAVEMMKQFDREEMVLIAQVQKRTTRAPPELKELMERRRQGATFQELWVMNDQLFGKDAEMLLIVRQWLTEVVQPKEVGAGNETGSTPAAPAQPLNIGGSISPVKK